MKEIIDKLSSYNLFNYLLPGIIFSYIITNITQFKLLQSDIFIGAFLYYLIGLIISRMGSLIIAPLLKEIKFIKFSEYKDYVIFSEKDKKIEIFSEVNNMYRTFISTFLLVMVIKGYSELIKKYQIINEWTWLIICSALLILFVFSYRKQTDFIVKRINIYKETK